MMKRLQTIILLWLLFLLTGSALAGSLDITLLHLNDIYEITPVSGGKAGGPARVATVGRRLRDQNPRTYAILAGDCLSPSALGTAKVDGERLAGRQMVEVLNAMGLDYATFGNHEFDLPEEQFKQRLTESRFQWFSGNVSDAGGQPFEGVPRYVVFSLEADDGAEVRIGLLGLTTAKSGYPDYVRVADPIQTARAQVEAIDADILIAVTHLDLADDQRLAETVPEIDLILGGHEHENIQQWRGADFTPIFKADANLRSVYIHRLRYDTATGELAIDSRLQSVTGAIPEDQATARVVDQWLERAFAGFRAAGFEPEQRVALTDIPLDGLESSVRNRSTALTGLLAEAMLSAAQDAELAVYNSGSIRIDDVIPPGPLTQYDVIRILPFGGRIMSVTMQGEVLKQVLDRGRASRGLGAYLQVAKVRFDAQAWWIGGEALAAERRYRVAINDFLLSGRESGLEFLTLAHPGIELIEEGRDLRFALIDALKKRWPVSE